MITFAVQKVRRSFRALSRHLQNWAFVGGLGSLLSIALNSPAIGVLMLSATGVTGFASTLLHAYRRNSGPVALRLSEDSKVLHLTRRGIPLENITSAYFLPDPDTGSTGTLHLATSQQEWSLSVSASTAEAFFDATQTGPRHGCQVITTSPALTNVGPKTLVLRLFVGGAGLYLLAQLVLFTRNTEPITNQLFGEPFPLQLLLKSTMFFGSIFFFGGLFSKTQEKHRIEFGTDGIYWNRFMRNRFFAYGDIKTAKLHLGENESVTIHTKNQGSHNLPLESPFVYGGTNTNTNNLAIFQQLLKHRLKPSANRSIPQLERGNRSLEEWTSALRRILEMGSFYRDAAITRADVVRVLQDTEASVEQRKGAALALLASDDSEAASLIGNVIAATANPELLKSLEVLLKDRKTRKVEFAHSNRSPTKRKSKPAREKATKVQVSDDIAISDLAEFEVPISPQNTNDAT